MRFGKFTRFDPRIARTPDELFARHRLPPRNSQQLAALADQLFAEPWTNVLKRIRVKTWHYDPALPVAIHEGSHVYTCFRQGIMLYGVSIKNDSGVVHARFDDPSVTDADRLKVDIAGGVATAIAENRPIMGRLNERGMDRDLEKIERIVDRHYGHHVADPQATEFFQSALVDTIAIVKDGWPTIMALAKALVIERKLGPSQIDEILETRMTETDESREGRRSSAKT